ncbi:hypothetical protein NFO65_22360 [Neorhizobium galegae]|uniref:hypothetical protein n=1 Tax=Neorhizobium galegae TaxID=399 RepID=UPI002100AC5F|nr:hypothetical protein [Neorhizobium galegae]MCQ1573473.1 hypothetical protein [Neorhizobium galegae]
MKIATGIMGIMLGLLVLLQSCAIGAGSSLTGDQAMADSGGIGMVAGFLLFVGGAFSFGLPLIGGIVFVIAALLAFMGADHFPDLKIWGVLSLALAVIAISAWRSGRKVKAAPSGVPGSVEG